MDEHSPATPVERNPHRRTYIPTINSQNPPPRLPRHLAAKLLLEVLGLQVSPRTLETWPLETRRVNSRATLDTAELLAHGRKLLDAAPAIRSGRRKGGA